MVSVEIGKETLFLDIWKVWLFGGRSWEYTDVKQQSILEHQFLQGSEDNFQRWKVDFRCWWTSTAVDESLLQRNIQPLTRANETLWLSHYFLQVQLQLICERSVLGGGQNPGNRDGKGHIWTYSSWMSPKLHNPAPTLRPTYTNERYLHLW